MRGTRCAAVGAALSLAVALVPTTPAGAEVVPLVNSEPITMTDAAAPAPATPYPSPIVVSGVSGAITDLAVVLKGVSHGYPDDLEVLLVGPTGVAVLLMADVGGGNANAVSGLELRFEDGSPLLPDQGPITSGTFGPTEGDGGPTDGTAFPAPAPAQTNSQLEAFNGTSPIGTWQLFVHDDAAGQNGSFAGGWSLELTIDSDACLNRPEDGFTDVTDANVHEAAIDCLVSYGVASGTSATTFNPSADVTRGQMASFVARAIAASGTALPPAPPDAFGDDDGNTHELRIDQLASLGVVGGNGESGASYFPNQPMRRDHMASYMFEAFEVITGAPLAAGPNAFNDDNGNAHEAAIDALAAEGVISGTGGGLFAPSGTVSRAQMGSFLARFLQLLDEKGALPG